MMKRIIFCIALSVISLAIAVGSFLTNDVVSYKNWIRDNTPKASDSFDKHMRRAPDEKRAPVEKHTPDEKRVSDEKREPGDKRPPMPEKKHGEHKAETKHAPLPPKGDPRQEHPSAKAP